VILRISHGYEVKETNDPFVEIADKATQQFSLATAPGGYLVDLIPACGRCLFSSYRMTLTRHTVRHIPLWFPGATFRRQAKNWSGTLLEMVERPYGFVKQQMV